MGRPGVGLRPPGRRQDGHDQRLHGRVVHRVHAARRLRGLGRIRRQTLDGHEHDRGARRPAGLDRVHEGRARRRARRTRSRCPREWSRGASAPRPASSRRATARRRIEEVFIQGNEPGRQCRLHSQRARTSPRVRTAEMTSGRTQPTDATRPNLYQPVDGPGLTGSGTSNADADSRDRARPRSS